MHGTKFTRKIFPGHRNTKSLSRSTPRSRQPAFKRKHASERLLRTDSQITYSALGQQAPLGEKEQWNPNFAKRNKIKAILDKSLLNSPFA